jgi:hypothetical protein
VDSYHFHDDQGHVVILVNAPGVVAQIFEDGIEYLLGARTVVAPDEILKTLFAEHGLVAVSRFPDAVRANGDHLARA